ncbi:MAG: molecular chaperone GrpE [Thermoproteota archaeon]|nr:molecular chaperone GrpE [Thermoproteota archaeon]
MLYFGGLDMSDKSTTSSEKLSEEPEVRENTPALEKEVENLRKALKKEQEKVNDYLNRLKYLQADFENFQRRTQKEMDEKVNYGNLNLICELLPVLGELELAVEAGKQSSDKNSIIEGIEMILKKTYDVLGRQGLRKIDAIGCPFDPNKHDAIIKVPTKDYKEGTVIEEIRKGFMLKGKVIRPSLVKVAIYSQNDNIVEKGDEK